MKKFTLFTYSLFLLLLLSTLTSFGVTNYWDGSSNTFWHNDNNWSLGHIPLSTEDVVITTAGEIPHVDFYDETCNSITINTGATLRIAGQTLTVANAVDVYGTLELTNTAAKLYCTYMTWRNGSTGSMSGSSVISISRNWEFSSGANVNFTSGYVDFTGTIASYITSKDGNCAFNHVRNFKSATYLAHSSASTTSSVINGNLYMYSGSELRSFSSQRIELNGFLNNIAGSIHLDSGIFEFKGGFTTNYLNSGDYFNNFMVSSTGTTTISDPITIKGFLWITQGVFNPNNNTVTIGGGWINSVGPTGFTEGTGRVIFNGTDFQYVNKDEEFNILEINKTGGAFRVNDATATVYCNSYDWTAGAVDILQGTFTAASLADNGIAGSWYLNDGGEINLTNTTSYVDLLGNLYIFGGTMNIYGGIDDSYWPYGSAGSSITMSGGTLDFKETGIYVQASGTLTENITGGNILTTGNLRLLRSGFTPSASIFTMYGTENAYIRLDAGSINQLDIAKTTAKTNHSGYTIPDYFSSKQEDGLPFPVINTTYFTNYSSGQSNSQIIKQPRDGSQKSPKVIGDVVTPYADINLDHIVIYSGTFNPDNHAVTLAGEMVVIGNLEMISFWDEINMRDFFWYPGSTANVTMGFLNVNRDWYFQDGTNAQLGGINIVTFIGSSDQSMHCFDADAEYGSVISDKTGGQLYVNGSVKVTGNMTIGAGDYFHPVLGDLIIDGTFDIVNTARMYLQVGTSITNYSEFILNGELTIIGDAFIHNNFQIASTGELIINTNGSFITDNNTTTTPIYGSLEMSDTGLFEVHSGISIHPTANININGGTVRLSGDFTLPDPNIWQPTGGTVEFFGIGHVLLNMAGSNHFYNLVINKDAGWQTKLAYNNIVIKNDFTINSGVFKHYLEPVFTMEVGGSWTNNVGDAGFLEEQSTVTINGTGVSQILTDETFYNLVCDKASSWETWIGSDLSVTTLNNMDIIAGNFRAPAATMDVNGNLTIATDALFVPPSYGKNLFIGGNWTNNNIANSNIKGFYPDGGSTVTFNGAGQQILTTNAPTEAFHHLIIDKPSDTLKSNDSLQIIGDFSILQGVMEDNVNGLSHEFYGDVLIDAAGAWSSYVTQNTTTFKGTADQLFTSNAGSIFLYNIIVDKSVKKSSSKKSFGENKPGSNGKDGNPKAMQLTINNGGFIGEKVSIYEGTVFLNGNYIGSKNEILIYDGGKLIADANSQVSLGAMNTLYVGTGGILEMIGTYGNEVLFRCISDYSFSNLMVMDGGTFSAQYVDFTDLGLAGLVVHDGATIDPAYCFNNCKFTRGSPSFPTLSIHNNQILIADSVYFHTNTAGGSANVYKAYDQGHITFTNAYGYYAGPAFENDYYNRIDWTGFTPGLWTGSYSTDWNDYRNWDNLVIPDNTVDVIIPAGTPNNPLVVAGTAQYCNSLNVQAGANLTINNNWLTVTTDVDILGGLTMDDALGKLIIGQNINWRSGSNANATLGTIIVYGSWTFSDGTNAQLGAGNTTLFAGSTNQSIYCYDAGASFGSINIYKPSSQVWLNNFSTDTMRLSGNLTVMSNNVFQVQNNNLLVNDTIDIKNQASVNILPGGSITGNSNTIISGTLSNNQGDVYLDDLTLFSGDIIIDGGTLSTLGSPVTSIGGALTILNDGIFNTKSLFMVAFGEIIMSSGLIRVVNNFTVGTSNSFQPTGGTVEIAPESSYPNINITNSNYFHNLKINGLSAYHIVYLDTDIIIKNDLNIINGILKCNGNKIEIGGNWNNTAGALGFEESTGTVVFNGNGNNQNVTAETFYNVLQEYVSTGSNLLFTGSTTILNNITLNYRTWINDVFDVQGGVDMSNPNSIFTANTDAIGTIANLQQGGTMNMNGGLITVNDLAENGIYGSVNVVSGELNYFQDAGSFVDLNCDLTMSGGIFNINSSNDNSLWTFGGDASVTMSGGILNFINCGVLIQDNANTFTENISGGTIRTDGIFKANRSQFTPSGGTIELYGGADVEITMVPGANFHNVLINKSGGKNTNTSYKNRDGNMIKSVMGNMVNMTSDISVNGDLTVDAGLLYDFTHSISCLGNVNINNTGTLSIGQNATLALDNLKTLSVNNGGNLDLTGSLGNEAKITHLNGYYSFNVESGGTIAAEYGIFEFMHTNGIYLKPGSSVNLAMPFNNCTFREGISGGSLMTVHTDQVFTVTDAVFPTNTWGGNHNVYKSANIGNVYFVGATGGFAGEAFEYDPTNHIHWSDHVFTLDLTVNLEGPFNVTDMNVGLSTAGLIPANQPYNISPWNYGGAEIADPIPANIVDWVLIDFIDAADAASATITNPFDKQAAFLLNNGSIVGLDGSSLLLFDHTIIQSLFVSVWHRNHVPVLSAYPANSVGSSSSYNYDFSIAVDQAYGTDAQKHLGNDIYGMIGGDANADSIIDINDKAIWSGQVGTTGYKSGDFDMDGQVGNTDKNEIWVGNNE